MKKLLGAMFFIGALFLSANAMTLSDLTESELAARKEYVLCYDAVVFIINAFEYGTSVEYFKKAWNNSAFTAEELHDAKVFFEGKKMEALADYLEAETNNKLDVLLKRVERHDSIINLLGKKIVARYSNEVGIILS